MTFVMDREEHLVYVNDAVCRFLGQDRSSLLGKRPSELFPDDIAAIYSKHIQAAFQELQAPPDEKLKRADGKDLWLDTRLVPIPDRDGKISSIFGIARDITERKQVEQMKSNFVNTVSHEFRTPLSIIRESMNLLKDGIVGEINEKQESVLDISIDNIDRLLRMMNNMLDLARFEAGRYELRRSPVDMAPLIRHVIAPFEYRAGTKNVKIDIILPEDNIKAFADADELLKVFNNLVGNALKFTQDGIIQISAAEKNGFIECSVTDSGVGISKDNLTRIFERFRQTGNSTSLGEKGVGLGLAIAKDVIDMHGGKIWAESPPSGQRRGTRFTFTIPKYKE